MDRLISDLEAAREHLRGYMSMLLPSDERYVKAEGMVKRLDWLISEAKAAM